MTIPRYALLIVSLSMFSLGTGPVSAQVYPSKPIRLVTSAPGGGNDFSSRIIAEGVLDSLGRVVVDNRGGGSGVIAIETVAKAEPNGYTILFYSNGLWTLPLLQDVPYDPVKDLAPITLFGITPTVLVVHPSIAARSVKELIALAKANPGKLNYATASIGSATHLAPEQFRVMTGTNMVRVSYKGSGPAIVDLLGGHVQLMFAVASSVAQHVKSNRLRALAVTTARPSELAPGLPTVAASGLPGFEVVSTQGVWAPAKTPAPIIARLHKEIVSVLNKPDVKKKLFLAGVDTVGSTPEEFAATIRSDMASLGTLIEKAHLRVR